MKTVKLLLAFMITALSLSAQPVYTVSVCGTITDSIGYGIPTVPLTIYFNGGSLGTYTDSSGNYCFNFTVQADSGMYADLFYAINYNNCNGTTQGDTVYVTIAQNAAFTENFLYCSVTISNCSVSIYQYADSNGTAILSAYPSGTAPFSYLWSWGGTTQDISPINYGDYCVTVTDYTGCTSSNCYYYSGNTNYCSVSISYFPDSIPEQLWAWAAGVAPYTFQWSTGDSTQYITPLQMGMYCVTVTDANGCVSDNCYQYSGPGGTCYVTIYLYNDSNPNTDYLYADAGGTYPFSYQWSMDNGGIISTSQIIYPNSPGTYCVMVTDANGCVSSACYQYGSTIIINCTASVYFTSYEDSSNVGTVNFTSYPSGYPPFTYNWYFSDGGSSQLPNPVYTFTQGSGWDWAYLEVTDDSGCVAYYSDYVSIGNGGNTGLCSASFYEYFDDINGTPGQVFFYDYSYSGNNINPNVSWAWDFGDGSSSTLQNPDHVYASTGYYTVCLTIADANGCTDSYCQALYIDLAWWLNSPWDSTGYCSAGFVAVQDSNLSGMVYLVDFSFGNNYLYYTWDFGNGTIINSQYPYVTFNSTGTYYVCLTITDTLNGCTDTYCDSVGVDSLGNLQQKMGSPGTWSISVIPAPVASSLVSVKEEIKDPVTIRIYPNPVADELTMKMALETSETVKAEVMDVTGKVIRSEKFAMNKGINSHRMDLKNISDGVYSIKISSAHLNHSERLVKMR